MEIEVYLVCEIVIFKLPPKSRKTAASLLKLNSNEMALGGQFLPEISCFAGKRHIGKMPVR